MVTVAAVAETPRARHTGRNPVEGQGGECSAGPALDAVNRRASASHPTPPAEAACLSVGRPRHPFTSSLSAIIAMGIWHHKTCSPDQ
jgi:hypothetical protein